MIQESNPDFDILTKQIAKGGGAIFTGRVVEKAISLVTTIILSRVLGAEILGLYVLGLGVLNLTSTLSRLGLPLGSIRYISIHHGTGEENKIKGVIFQALFLSFFGGLVIALIVFFSADLISMIFFKNIDMVPVIRLFSICIPFFSAYSVANAISRGFKIMKYYVYVQNFFQPLTNLFLVSLFFMLGLTLTGAIYAKIASIVLALFLAIYYTYKIFPALLNKNIRPEFNISTLLTSSIPLLGVNFLQFLITWIDVLMIGYFLLPGEVGIYRSAAQVTLLLTIILSSFNSILGPLVAELFHKKDKAGVEHIFKVTTKWIFNITTPLFIILVFSRMEILNLFGEEFTAGANVLLVLAFARLINNSTGNIGYLFIMSGREKLEFFNTFLLVISNIVFNILLIPRYGIIGAAIAAGSATIFVNLFRVVQVKKLLGIFPYDSRYIKGLLASGLSIVVLFITRPFMSELHYILSILVVSLLTITITILTLVSLRLDKEDRIILRAVKMRITTFMKKDF